MFGSFWILCFFSSQDLHAVLPNSATLYDGCASLSLDSSGLQWTSWSEESYITAADTGQEKPD